MHSNPDRVHAAARGFAGMVRAGLLDYAEAHTAMERAADTAEDAVYALAVLAEAMMQFDLAASWDIRRVMGDLMAARKPREAILLAAYRAANGRLSSAEIETIVRQEMTAYVQRIRGTAR